MLVRVIFTAILLGSTIYAHYQSDKTSDLSYITILYYLIGFIFALSIFYAFIFKRIQRQVLFTYIQFLLRAAFTVFFPFFIWL